MDTLRLQRACSAAIAAEQSTKLPRQITLAQWALESGWGEHQPGNNCFGIKEYPGACGVQELITTEVYHGVSKKVPQWFARFETLGDCFTKHAQLITLAARYSIPWGNFLANGDVNQLIDSIAPIYATDPDYAIKLHSILAMPQVQEALSAVLWRDGALF